MKKINKSGDFWYWMMLAFMIGALIVVATLYVLMPKRFFALVYEYRKSSEFGGRALINSQIGSVLATLKLSPDTGVG